MREKNFARSTVSEENWGPLVVYQTPNPKTFLVKALQLESLVSFRDQFSGKYFFIVFNLL